MMHQLRKKFQRRKVKVRVTRQLKATTMKMVSVSKFKKLSKNMVRKVSSNTARNKNMERSNSKIRIKMVRISTVRRVMIMVNKMMRVSQCMEMKKVKSNIE